LLKRFVLIAVTTGIAGGIGTGSSLAVHSDSASQATTSGAKRTFAKLGVVPHWELRTERAWLNQYRSGLNWGPARDPVQILTNGEQVQHFARGTATLSDGSVSWTKLAGASKRGRYDGAQWRQLSSFAKEFGRLVVRRNGPAAKGLFSPGPGTPARRSCAPSRLLLGRWPAYSVWNVRTWGAENYISEHFIVGGRLYVDRLQLVDGPRWRVASVKAIVPRRRRHSHRCPGWTPPRNTYRHTLGIGDSIMVDSMPYLRDMGVSVDAAVGRQFSTGRDDIVYREQTGLLPKNVVIGLGTNGPMTKRDYNHLLWTLRHENRVVVVTVAAPVWWVANVNTVIEAVAKRHSNVRVADWNGVSSGHSEYFVSDGIHLTGQGDWAYARMISNALSEP
jgi:hypothetical protein